MHLNYFKKGTVLWLESDCDCDSYTVGSWYQTYGIRIVESSLAANQYSFYIQLLYLSGQIKIEKGLCEDKGIHLAPE